MPGEKPQTHEAGASQGGSSSDGPLLLGIDVGTGGVRAVVAGKTGTLVARAAVPFDPHVLDAQQDRCLLYALRPCVTQIEDRIRQIQIAINQRRASAPLDGIANVIVAVGLLLAGQRNEERS